MELENVILSDTWNLYLHYKDLGECYNDNIEKLMEINDIFTFWRTYNNIPKTYDIFSDGVNKKIMKRNGATPCAYSFFRKDISPRWEDPKNTNGFELSIRNSKDFPKLENDWLNSLLVLISNENEMYKHINGIRVVDCTKNTSVLYRIEYWFDSNEHREYFEKNLRDFFNLQEKIIYRSHVDIKET